MRTRYLVLALLLVLTATVPSSASPVPQPPELWTVTADGATEAAIATGPEGQYLTRSFEWSPDGTKLVFTKAGDIWISNPDGTGQVNLTSTDALEEFDPHWSPDGSEIVFVRTTGNGSDLLIAEADGSGIRPLTTDEGYERSPRWSPTGEWILFQTICVDCDEDLELIRPDGSERLVLTDDDVRDLIAVWSPDGTQIAIVRGPGTTNGNELWVIDADATDLTLLKTDVANEEPSWAPSGDALIVRASASSFAIVPISGAVAEVISAGDIVDWDWSPDSTQVAYSSGALHAVNSDGSGSFELVAESQMQSGDKLPDYATVLDWSADGARIAFSNGTDVFVWTMDGSEGLTKTTQYTYATDYVSLAWAPDGSRIAYLRTPSAGSLRFVSLVASRERVTFGGSFRLGGTVEGGDANTPAECIDGVTVNLLRRPLGTDDVESVATTTTEASGSFKFEGLSADRSAAYVAELEQTGGCSAATSAAETVKVRKKVTLSGPPIGGGRVRLKADVKPCKGHRGDRVLLQKRKGGRWVTVDRDRSDDRCRAVFVQAIGSRSVFRAKAPKTDEDHLAGTSATLVIHVD